MKLYTCIDHDYVWPVGVASIVVARDEKRAQELLDMELGLRGLKEHKKCPYSLVEVDEREEEFALILRDGNY